MVKTSVMKSKSLTTMMRLWLMILTFLALLTKIVEIAKRTQYNKIQPNSIIICLARLTTIR